MSGSSLKAKNLEKWPFRFILISRLVEMKGYLSFVRQISAINAPKANTKLLSVKPIGVFLIFPLHHQIVRHTSVHTVD